MRRRVRWRGDERTDGQAESEQGAQETVQLCTLAADCQCDASAGGSIKQQATQWLLAQSLPCPTPCKPQNGAKESTAWFLLLHHHFFFNPSSSGSNLRARDFRATRVWPIKPFNQNLDLNNLVFPKDSAHLLRVRPRWRSAESLFCCQISSHTHEKHSYLIMHAARAGVAENLSDSPASPVSKNHHWVKFTS